MLFQNYDKEKNYLQDTPRKNENNIQVEIDLSLYCNGKTLPGEKVKTLFVKDY